MKNLKLGLIVAAAIVLPCVGMNAMHDHGGMHDHGAMHDHVAVSDLGARDGAGTSSSSLEIVISDGGPTPTELRVKPGEPVRLSVTRKTDRTCATQLVVPEFGIDRPLPLGAPVVVEFTPKASGRIRLLCGMGETISTLIVR
jgi:hypothetical protein